MEPESSLISSHFGPIQLTTSTSSYPKVELEFTASDHNRSTKQLSYSSFHDNIREKIISYLQGNTDVGMDYFDFDCTPFQLKVLEAVCKIPYGKTASYFVIAKSIGYPKAIRAVASAIAKNRALILIPCHRVIRSDGSFGKYRAGTKIKKQLIEFEKANLEN